VGGTAIETAGDATSMILGQNLSLILQEEIDTAQQAFFCELLQKESNFVKDWSMCSIYLQVLTSCALVSPDAMKDGGFV